MDFMKKYKDSARFIGAVFLVIMMSIFMFMFFSPVIKAF
jgi:hypothetical protein